MRILAGLSLASLSLLAACPATDDPVGGVCGSGFNAQTGAVGDFGTGDAARKVEAFLRASGALAIAGRDIDADTLAACTAMATDLGIPAAELAPTADELPSVAACTRVVEEIDAIVATLPTNASIGITISPVECAVEFDAAATCAAECDATVTGTAEVTCMGELHGSCSGSCTGSCTVEGNVACEGACSGTCTGTCSGTCTGTCNGSCDLEDASGNCIGTCTGECTGTCDAACQGTCEGACTAAVTASCQGECYGECDATWDAECNGSANLDVEADCEAACEVEANATASCTEPTIEVVGVNIGDPTAQARIDTLVETLIANYPAIVALQQRTANAFATIDEFAVAVQGAAAELADVSLQAGACLASAGDAVADAVAQIEGSVTVTVMVSASVSASGSAQ